MADAHLAAEVWTGALMLAGLAALLLALLWRPLRRPAFAAATAVLAIVLAWLAAAHLFLLLVEAQPTDYCASPTGFAAAAQWDDASVLAMAVDTIVATPLTAASERRQQH